MSELNRVGEDLPNWSPRQPERIADLKRSRERRPGRFAPWERDIAFLIGFYEAALENLDDPVAVVRRGVESGTIKGEDLLDAWPGAVEVWMCKPHGGSLFTGDSGICEAAEGDLQPYGYDDENGDPNCVGERFIVVAGEREK